MNTFSNNNNHTSTVSVPDVIFQPSRVEPCLALEYVRLPESRLLVTGRLNSSTVWQQNIPASNEGVQQAKGSLASASGSEVQRVETALAQMVNDALKSSSVVHDEDYTDPCRLAQTFLRQERGLASADTVKFWRGEFYRWEQGGYAVIAPEEMKAQLWAAIQAQCDEANALNNGSGRGKRYTTTNDLRNNVKSALESLTLVRGAVEQPCWLDDSSQLPASEMLAARNGIVHVPSVIGGQEVVLPSTPAFFTSMALDYDIDFKAPQPTEWLAFLDALWGQDVESIETLQEWFGYCLLPDTSLQKMLFLLGVPRSGKGTIAKVLTALVGSGNVVCPTLPSLASSFGLWPLLGKTLAILNDARLSGRSDQSVVVERLLSISGEDRLSVDRKNLTSITVRLPARIMLISNELPKLTDVSGALGSRLLMLRLSRSWEGQEDPKLADRLLPELPGVLLWALKGLERLKRRGRFSQPLSGQALLDQMKEIASPIKAFVSECCDIDPAAQETKYALYQMFKRWAEDRNLNAGSASTFGRDLAAAFPDIEDCRPNKSGSDRKRQYRGIKINSNAIASQTQGF